MVGCFDFGGRSVLSYRKDRIIVMQIRDIMRSQFVYFDLVDALEVLALLPRNSKTGLVDRRRYKLGVSILD